MRAAQFAYFDHDGPIAMAHRGGALLPASQGLENTLLAFRNAVGLGYRYLETDVHATADGQIVAFHDAVLDRVTDGSGAIADRPYAAVQEALIGGREHIPTLSELLTEFPDTRINIDLKAAGAVDATARILLDHDALDRVCVGSFDQGRLHRIRRILGPRLATAAGQHGTAALRFLPRTLSLLVHSPAPVLQIPASIRVRGREVTIVTRSFLDTVHRLGKQVHVWFYPWQTESEQEFHRLLDLGVDGLVVDRIDVLAAVVTQRGGRL